MCFRWSENSVRFEILWESAFRRAELCEILPHCVRYGMFEHMAVDPCEKTPGDQV